MAKLRADIIRAIAKRGTKTPEKYNRGIFIYLEPREKDRKEDFAQCGSCRMFIPRMALNDKRESRCIIHGAKVAVDDDDSCGFWVPWPKGKAVPEVIDDHAREIDKGVLASVTPEQSGLVDEEVQCHRCIQFDAGASKCRLYEFLNSANPDQFDLDVNVKPHACCNAWNGGGADVG